MKTSFVSAIVFSLATVGNAFVAPSIKSNNAFQSTKNVGFPSNSASLDVTTRQSSTQMRKLTFK